MTNSRRRFLRIVGGLAAGLALPKAATAAPLMPVPGEGEDYWEQIRQQFSLRDDLIFLNNGTIGPSPYKVRTAVADDMARLDCEAAYNGREDAAIAALARFVGAEPDEISLTHNTSEGINIVCAGLDLKAGDELIISNQEHAGHGAVWLHRQKKAGIKIICVEPAATTEETLERFKAAFTHRTRVLSVPHIPCTTGQVLPVKALCAFARERGVFTLIDGAHPPGMLQLDVHDIGCDAYAACCHKWLCGPKGTGFLFVRRDARNCIDPIFVGAGVDTGWRLTPGDQFYGDYTENGKRFFYGTQNAALQHGIAAAVAFQEAIGVDAIEKRVKQLASELQTNLLSLGDKIEMLTPTETISRGAQIAFRIKGKDMLAFRNACAEKRIITRFVPESNLNCLRVSCHIYNNKKQLEKFVVETERFMRA